MSEKATKNVSGSEENQSPLQVFVCELGFSSMKWLNDANKDKGRIISAYKRHGEEMTVGEDALNTPNPSYLRTVDDLVMVYPFMCEESLKEAGIPASKKGNIHMVIGLPYSNWEKEVKQPGRGRVGILEKTLMADGYAKVSVFPQGIGGIRSWIEGKDEVKGNILGIDVGFNTVIFTLYNPSKKKILYGNTFSKRGIHQMVMDHLAPRIEQLFPSRCPIPISMCYMLENGRVQYGDNNEDIRPDIEIAAREYANILISEIKSELEGNVGEAVTFDTMLFFGGGAYFIKEYVPKGKNIAVEVLKSPEFANSIGMASAARNS